MARMMMLIMMKAVFFLLSVGLASVPNTHAQARSWFRDTKPIVANRRELDLAKDRAKIHSSVVRFASENALPPLRARNQGGEASPRVVCYFTNWAQYRPGLGKYTPANINTSASLCTHIHFAFAKIENGELAPYEWNDPDHDGHKGNFRMVTDIKETYPNLKVLLSVGGWNMNSRPFSQMARTQESRGKFIMSAIKLLKEYNFDGLDIDWEYPTQRDSPVPEDKHRFTLLLKETAKMFKNPSKMLGKGERRKGRKSADDRLMLTVALAAGEKIINEAYEWTKIHKYLDYAVVMSYDFHGSWDNVTGENSPLYNADNDPGMSVNASTALWMSHGFPSKKLVVGVASYGRSFTLKSEAESGLGAPVNGPGQAQQYTRLGGLASFYEVCGIIKDGGRVERLSTQDVPYVVKQRQWIGYDDESSFRDKLSFVRDGKLGGVSMWSLDLDDFSGKFCGAGVHPLLRKLVSSTV